MKGEIYSAVGYGGDDSGSWDASGRRRRRDDLFVECPYDQCSLRYQFAMRDTEFLGDTGVCQGDSGGPALDAEGRVIGVVSRGGAGCSSPIYGAVYGWAQWIKDTTASAAISAGLDVPLWTRGFSTSPEFNYPVVTHVPTAASVLRVSAKRACARGCVPRMDHVLTVTTVIHSGWSACRIHSIRPIHHHLVAVIRKKRAMMAAAHRRMARLWPCLGFGGLGGASVEVL